MENTPLFFLIIIILFTIQSIVLIFYSRRAVVFEHQCDNYMKRNSIRGTRVERANHGAKPVRPDIAQCYIESYIVDTGNNRTKGIEIDIETVSFYYDYLLKNPSKNLAIGYAKYDRELLATHGLKDPDLEANLSKNKKYTLMVGCCDKGGKKAEPFVLNESIKEMFYDDWNQEWP